MRSLYVLSILLLLGAALQAEQTDQRPNIILIMADDLGYGDVGFNGNTIIKTPHLDAMAADGLVWRRIYAAAPVCSPTRGSCLTGRHPYRYGITFANTGHMLDQEITLAELLQANGYRTGHFGKWHLGTLTTEIKDANRGGPQGKQHFAPPVQHGFDVCFSTESKVPTYDPMWKPSGKAPSKGWDALAPDAKRVSYGTRYWNERGKIQTENLEGDDSRVIMDRVAPFVEQSAAEKRPFFTVIWFHTPHLPVVAGPEHATLYAQYDSYTKNYYGCISAMDEQIGRLRHTLTQAGVAGSTMIWFCSDNGPEGKTGQAPGSAGSLRGRKRSLYEGGIRVPAVLVWPGHAKAGSSTDFPAVTSDYFPTIVDLLKLSDTKPQDPTIDGISLLPVIAGEVKHRDSAIGFQQRKQHAWTTHQYKLHSDDGGRNWELYDLLTDPGETTDLSARNPELVRSLSADFLRWQQSCYESSKANGL